MSKIRFLILLSTFLVVGTVATIISLYARGYRFSTEKSKITPNGLLVIKSNPDSAQIYINGSLKTATNATIPMPPGNYDVSVRKEGFKEWQKRLSIQKEVVTEATAHLFKSTPSLTAVTLSAAVNTTPSPDFTKIAYIVPANTDTVNTAGLYIMETINLPLGFARDPQRVTDGNLNDVNYIWSPDGREILLTTATGTFLFQTSTFTPQSQRVNVAGRKEKILLDWNLEEKKLLEAKSRKLPDQLEEIILKKASQITYSPDEDMLLYTASSSAEIPAKLVRELPGASTQKEERTIKPGNTYVYDIKEDKNFLIYEGSDGLDIKGGVSNGFTKRISWYASSRNLILAEPEKIVIMDYDGTNRQTVYSGSYIAPNAFPTLSMDRLLILTNLGATTALPNLYSLSLK